MYAYYPSILLNIQNVPHSHSLCSRHFEVWRQRSQAIGRQSLSGFIVKLIGECRGLSDVDYLIIPGESRSCSRCFPGLLDTGPKWLRSAPNGTNPGLFQIRFQYIWLIWAKCTEIWSEKVHLVPGFVPFGARICPIWGQSDPLWSQTYHPCSQISSTGMSNLAHSQFGPTMGQIWDVLRQLFISSHTFTHLPHRNILRDTLVPIVGSILCS